MSLYKRGGTWWTDFSVNGQRFRLSLDTSDWREAQRQEKEKIAEAQGGKLTPAGQQLARLGFSDAADRYLEGRSLDLAERSRAKEKELLNHPKRYFGSVPLSKLTPEMLRDYLTKRKAAGLSNATLNMVIGAIRRVLKMGRRWHLFEDDLRRLPEHSNVGRALTAAELSELLTLADSRGEWLTLRCAIVLALNTTMRSAELKHLRWKDIDFFESTIIVRRSKTEAGQRAIPMNEDAFSAMLRLLKQAQKAQVDSPDHFIFPACENGTIDASKYQKSWRTAWRTLTRGIRCPACGEFQSPGKTCREERCKADINKIKSPFASLRFHDLRHTAITVLAESDASEQTVMAIAGHVSRKMLEHYSHIRMDAKRRAVAALVSNKSESAHQHSGSYVTKHVTNAAKRGSADSQLLEKNGGPGLTRTTDLTLIRGAL
jgi:integrase